MSGHIDLNALPELLPCPFCRYPNIRFLCRAKEGRGFDHHGDDIWTIDCPGCGAMFPGRYNAWGRDHLIALWNRRDPEPWLVPGLTPPPAEQVIMLDTVNAVAAGWMVFDRASSTWHGEDNESQTIMHIVVGWKPLPTAPEKKETPA